MRDITQFNSYIMPRDLLTFKFAECFFEIIIIFKKTNLNKEREKKNGSPMHKIRKEQEANGGMSSDLLSRYCRAALNHSGKQVRECTLTHTCKPTRLR